VAGREKSCQSHLFLGGGPGFLQELLVEHLWGARAATTPPANQPLENAPYFPTPWNTLQVLPYPMPPSPQPGRELRVASGSSKPHLPAHLRSRASSWGKRRE
jgi:hypothetical protein